MDTTVTTSHCKPRPLGVYVLGVEKFDTTYLINLCRNPSVDGLSVRVHLKDLRPNQSEYDWRGIDRVLGVVEKFNKGVFVRIIGGVYCPSWLWDAGVSFAEAVDWTDGPTRGLLCRQPIPWCPEWHRVMAVTSAEFWARYMSNPALRIVGVTGGGMGGEMQMLDSGEYEFWLASGYSTKRIRNSWRNFSRLWGMPGSGRVASLSIGRPVSNDHGTYALSTIVDAHKDELRTFSGVQMNSLHATTNTQWFNFEQVYDFPGFRGFQTLCPVRNVERFGGTLAQAWVAAKVARPHWLELYHTDLYDEPNTVMSIHDDLLSGA